MATSPLQADFVRANLSADEVAFAAVDDFSMVAIKAAGASTLIRLAASADGLDETEAEAFHAVSELVSSIARLAREFETKFAAMLRDAQATKGAA